jgi:N-acetylglucosaminyl-diphospho-decaprenol L-rhamnosyltransferase
MPPKLDIVIVNWNAGDLLVECIDSMKVAQHPSFILNKIIIVDNNSQDNSIQQLDKISDLPLLVIQNDENVGFGKACNAGVREGDGDLLLILNPDTKLYADSIYVPVEFILREANKNIGMIGIKLIDEDNQISRNCARFPTPSKIFCFSLGLDKLFPKIFPPHFMTEWDHNDSRFVDQIMGSYIIMPRELYERLNGYDDNFFVYYEDLDLTLRANRLGYKNYYLAEAAVFHKGGGSSDKVKAARLFYITHSKLIYSKKHFSKIGYLVVLMMTLFIEPITRVIYGIFKLSFSNIIETLKAYKKLYSKLLFG